MRNHSYGSVFRLHVHFHVNQTHLKVFERRLVLKQSHEVTRKWSNSYVYVAAVFTSAYAFTCAFAHTLVKTSIMFLLILMFMSRLFSPVLMLVLVLVLVLML